MKNPFLGVAVAGLATSLTLSSCSGEESDEAKESSIQSANPATTTPSGRFFDDAEVYEFIGATEDDRFGGRDMIITLDNGDTCSVDQILSNHAMVAMYVDAGDPVATNSEGWMGIKVGSYEGATASCLDEVNARLADFK